MTNNTHLRRSFVLGIVVPTLFLSGLASSGLAQSENASSRGASGKKNTHPLIPKFVDPELPEGMQEGNQRWKDLKDNADLPKRQGRSASKQEKGRAADRAEQFYLQFPNHPKARRAKKAEIDALLSIDDGSDASVHPRLKNR